MRLSAAAALVSFFGALAIGTGAAYVVGGIAEEIGPVEVSDTFTPEYVVEEAPATAVEEAPVRAKDLVGVWRGTWDHAGVPCTIEIDRVEGNKFFGTLRQEGAKIAIAGTFDADGRRVFFHEIKVLNLGFYTEWSLGTNNGTFSPDGRTLTGTGIDKWGTYPWDVSLD